MNAPQLPSQAISPAIIVANHSHIPIEAAPWLKLYQPVNQYTLREK